MLTPIEIQSKSFKSGIGYDRKDVDAFMREVLNGYEKLYKENVELKDKVNVLNEGIQYYKTIEKTLQKALVLAEQTAEETKQVALRNAKVIEKEAHGKANAIIADAKNELSHINQMITQLTQQYESYKVQYKQLAASQIELLKSPTFELTLMNGETLKTSYTNPIDTETMAEESADIDKNDSDSVEDTNLYQTESVDDNDYNVNENDFNENDVNRNDINNYNVNNYDVNEFSKTSYDSSNESDDSDFTMVEEAAVTQDDTSAKIASIDSEFEFINFEVNLD